MILSSSSNYLNLYLFNCLQLNSNIFPTNISLYFSPFFIEGKLEVLNGEKL